MENDRFREDIEIGSRYLRIPTAAVILSIVLLIGYLSQLYLSPPGIFSDLLFSIGVLAVVCTWGSIWVYYKEAKQLKNADAPWIPSWGLYAIGTLIFGVPVVAWYLFKRTRNTGDTLPL